MRTANFLCQFDCQSYVPSLRVFVASNEQYYKDISLLPEIDAVSGTVIDAHFRNASTNRSHVSRIPK